MQPSKVTLAYCLVLCAINDNDCNKNVTQKSQETPLHNKLDVVHTNFLSILTRVN